MSVNISTLNVKREVRTRAVALPFEHGSWGFLFEPITAGLLVAFSPAAPWIALLVIGAFLTRQPLKIYLTDWKAGRKLPQTEVAFKFILYYSLIFACGLIGSLAFAAPISFLPFVLVAPFGIYQIYCDASRQSRQLIPELTGAVAISSSAAVMALAAGWNFAAAAALWAIFIGRLIPSILYVRNRLRLEKGKEFSKFVPFAAHLISLFVIGALAYYNLSPVLTVIMFAFLLGRSAVGLSPYRKKIKAMRIGVWEVIYGTLTVLSIVIGYYFNL